MNKKYYLIYQITNNINGKIYIGKHETDNLDDDYFDILNKGFLSSGKPILFRRVLKKNQDFLFSCDTIILLEVGYL